MKTELPHLLLAVDLGGSGTKIVGGIQGREGVKVSLMMPHCFAVKDPSELLYDPDFTEHNTWVKFDGIGYAVGNLAATKYNAINKLRPAKFTTAVVKICAAIAVFAQLFKLPKKFNLSLTYVLPPAEWEQKQIVIDRLPSALKDLETPRGKIKAKLLLDVPEPEGKGIMLGQQIDLKSVEHPVTVIMLGYRNASVLSAMGKVGARPNTCDLGFSDLLGSIKSKTGYNIDDIIVPVFKYNKHKKNIATVSHDLIDVTMRLQRYNASYASDREIANYYEQQIIDSKKELSLALNPLLRCSGADRATELDHLIKCIDSANKEYWKKLTDWLDESMPNQSSYICLSGGTANYFKDELELYAKNKIVSYSEDRLRWHTKVDAAKDINVSDDRFNDIYVLWTVMVKKYQPAAATKGLS